MDTKIWKTIPDYPNYIISTDGEVKNIKRDKILKPSIIDSGYMVITLSKNGKRKTHLLHRLVCKSFINNPFGYTCVNHIDENKTNNSVFNLMWCNHLINNNYGTRNERISNAHKKRIVQMTLDGEEIKVWGSEIEIEDTLGYKQPVISNCCNGRCKKAYGYRWKFYE